MEFLQSLSNPFFAIIGFILSISILVTIHEYGHFWVARRFGVKIEAFSVGFGKPIKKWRGKDGVDYIIGSLPLGGYVKMYGENADSADEPGSFMGKPPLQRFLIAFAGPAVNILFTVVILWGLFFTGVEGFRPDLGNIKEKSRFYQAGLQQNDTILSVDNKVVNSVMQATVALVDSLGSDKVAIKVKRNFQEQTFTADLTGFSAGSELDINQAIGFTWQFQEEISQLTSNQLHTVEPNSPADLATLQAGDVVTSLNDVAITNWQDMVAIIINNPNQTLPIEVLRQGERLNLNVTLSQNPKNKDIGYLGTSPVYDNDKYALVVQSFVVDEKYSLFGALAKASDETLYQAGFLLRMLKKLVIGQISVKNMGGPISIADYSGQAIKLGFEPFIRFLALMSITLAVMNLLPIPALDGGHMLIYGVEMIMRRPLSARAINLLMRVGVSLLLTFMAFIISMDVLKYLKLI